MADCLLNLKVLSPIFLLIQIQLMRLLVGSLVGLLVGKSYHTKQKDGYSLPTNDPTNNRTNWIWTSKKIGLKYFVFTQPQCVCEGEFF